MCRGRLVTVVDDRQVHFASGRCPDKRDKREVRRREVVTRNGARFINGVGSADIAEWSDHLHASRCCPPKRLLSRIAHDDAARVDGHCRARRRAEQYPAAGLGPKHRRGRPPDLGGPDDEAIGRHGNRSGGDRAEGRANVAGDDEGQRGKRRRRRGQCRDQNCDCRQFLSVHGESPRFAGGREQVL